MTVALTDATDRVAQRINLADGDLAAAFDRLGTGLQANALVNLATNIDDPARLALMVGLVVVESDRGQAALLARHARAYAEADRRWGRDVNRDQLTIDGIEPARHLRGESITHRQKLRVGIWARASGACEDCGRGGDGVALDLHHLTYDRYGHERATDLLLLCRGCHDRRHGR